MPMYTKGRKQSMKAVTGVGTVQQTSLIRLDITAPGMRSFGGGDILVAGKIPSRLKRGDYVSFSVNSRGLADPKSVKLAPKRAR